MEQDKSFKISIKSYVDDLLEKESREDLKKKIEIAIEKAIQSRDHYSVDDEEEDEVYLAFLKSKKD